MKSKTQRVAEMVEELRQMFPDMPSCVGLSYYPAILGNPPPTITFHGLRDNAEGTTFLRDLGIGERQKTVIETENPWHSLAGEKDGVLVSVYCGGLPPSCRKVTETIKVPKQQTVDTGEFIEIQQTRIVCGNDKHPGSA